MAKYVEFNDSGKSYKDVQPIASSSGGGDAAKIIQTDGSGLIDPSFLPDADAKEFTSSEILAAGDIVNIHDSTGPKVRKASAALGVSGRAMGFIKVGVGSGVAVTVFRDGVITGLSGLTIGAKQFLSSTAGLITETPPTTATHIVQQVGDAEDTTEMAFEAGETLIRIA